MQSFLLKAKMLLVVATKAHESLEEESTHGCERGEALGLRLWEECEDASLVEECEDALLVVSEQWMLK